MSALGLCGKIASASIVVNEITTVASVYALAQFTARSGTAIGTSSTNPTGIVNGFLSAGNLYDGTTGRLRAKTPAGNGTLPASRINSLANILANCVESQTGSPACSALFQATTAGGVVPEDTLVSIHNVALHPGLDLRPLSLSGPYQPSLAGAPNDWTLSVEYTGGGLSSGQLIAADSAGNIWVPNAVNPGTISKFGPAGEPLSGPSGFKGGGLSYPQAVAVDQAGNVWAANMGNNTVSKHNASGVAVSGSGYTASELKLPYALALDGSGNAITANGNNTVTKLSSSASGVLAGQFRQGGLDFPYAIAIDKAQNLWVANYGYGNNVTRFSNSGSAAAANGYTGGGVTGAVGVALDASGNAWVASFDRPVVSKFGADGSPLSGSGYAIPAGAASIAVDGDNTVWTANSDGSVSRFSNAGVAISPATGFVSNGATAEVGIAIDPSGNVWTSDNYVNSIFEYVGAAAPTVAPLQVAVKNNLLGKRP
jgi:sugar lactone lactonase YvrE